MICRSEQNCFLCSLPVCWKVAFLGWTAAEARILDGDQTCAVLGATARSCFATVAWMCMFRATPGHFPQLLLCGPGVHPLDVVYRDEFPPFGPHFLLPSMRPLQHHALSGDNTVSSFGCERPLPVLCSFNRGRHIQCAWHTRRGDAENMAQC